MKNYDDMDWLVTITDPDTGRSTTYGPLSKDEAVQYAEDRACAVAWAAQSPDLRVVVPA